MSNAQLEMLQKLAAENALTGIFPGVDSETYHRGPGISSSYLKKAKAKSFLHAEYDRMNPKDQTPSMAFGTLGHHAIELGNEFEKHYVVSPKFDKRTKEGKANAEAFLTENKGKLVCDQDSFDSARMIRDNVYSHPELSKMLVGAHHEDSVYWTDPETKILCRARPDVVTKERAILDWKTTRNASKHAFKTDSYKLGYHVSAAMYVEGMTAVGQKPTDYLIVAIESEAPHQIKIFRPIWELFEAGRKDFRSTLNDYFHCRQMGVYPGFGHEPVELGIPHFAIEALYED